MLSYLIREILRIIMSCIGMVANQSIMSNGAIIPVYFPQSRQTVTSSIYSISGIFPI